MTVWYLDNANVATQLLWQMIRRLHVSRTAGSSVRPSVSQQQLLLLRSCYSSDSRSSSLVAAVALTQICWRQQSSLLNLAKDFFYCLRRPRRALLELNGACASGNLTVHAYN
ncbi:unnamed protein product [Ceratitis capitata]|uniref:(Mediterranean fruit fly) hypothetical protein n=1 Tax=Ceratitis capitata TaxID=7213 RepID=A0A811VEI9_CERCA|nr:unnamed protein product [Ceratitis capitata]